jgi:hypothetical protein
VPQRICFFVYSRKVQESSLQVNSARYSGVSNNGGVKWPAISFWDKLKWHSKVSPLSGVSSGKQGTPIFIEGSALKHPGFFAFCHPSRDMKPMGRTEPPHYWSGPSVSARVASPQWDTRPVGLDNQERNFLFRC